MLCDRIPCRAPENLNAWNDFVRNSLVLDKCNSQWFLLGCSTKLFVCLSTVFLLVLEFIEVLSLCHLPPTTTTGTNQNSNQYLKSDECNFCGIKLNFHDISLVTKSISILSNFELLWVIVMENRDALIGSIELNVFLLITRMFVSFLGYLFGIVKGSYSDMIQEGLIYVLRIIHFLQLCCLTESFYRRCLYFF
ncbi:uncharacterized protein LOC129949167 [Eupeodes corollae]|uniref:uncharacterized protein LOC129949167 n=1 Tax=Eupeodes corollae TaxID=290404 RepID=UPI002492FF84|nr:uncharacterized protein LOC129949167 [Eupeodes corollae]